MIQNDSKLPFLVERMMTGLADGNVELCVKASASFNEIARSYLVETETPVVNLTAPMPCLPLPECTGLGKTVLSMNEPAVICAFPGDGKTTMGVNLAAYWVGLKHPTKPGNLRVHFIVNEGRAEKFLADIYRAYHAQQEHLSQKRITGAEVYEDIASVHAWRDESSLTIHDATNFGPAQIIALMTKIASKGKAEVILFDWFHNVTIFDDAKKSSIYSKMAHEIENICKKWIVPVVVIGQMNREGGRENTTGAPGLGVFEYCPEMEKKAGLVINMRNGYRALQQKQIGIRRNDGRSFFWINKVKDRNGPIFQTTAAWDYKSGALMGPLSDEELEEHLELLKPKKK